MSDTSEPTEAPEPQSVSEAISSSPDRYAAPAPEPEATEAAETPETEAVEPEAAETPEPEAEDQSLEDLDDIDLEEPEAPAAEDQEPAGEDPFAEYGGKETVEQALRLHQASQSEEGIIQLFLESGRNLGLSLQQIESLFTGGQAPAGESTVSQDPETGEYSYEDDPERPITKKDLEEFQRQQAQQAQQAEAQRRHEAAVQTARSTVAETLSSLEIEPGSQDANLVLQMGNEYLPKGELDPDKIKEAVRRGHADFTALVEQKSREYLSAKKKARKVPKSPSGASAPAEAEPEEPRDTAEAIKRARAMYMTKS